MIEPRDDSMQNGGGGGGARTMRQHQSVKRQLSRGASLDADVIIAPNKDGFIPPWDGWDFNDVEQCTDDLRVSRPRPPTNAMK